MLRLSDSLSLPLTAQTETFAILAQRGAGKSNTAAVMAEEMFGAGLHFVVIDPVGAWWGLRASGTGKFAGLAIPIFGGKHGDIPLTRHAGTQVADLIVGKRLTAVVDLSQFESEAAKKQFLLDFARTLYQKNEQPLHLFLEEADDYIPQRPMRDEALLLRAFENLVRRGRSRGIGLTLITQRSASLNKSVLTQVGTLFAMRTTGPHDRAAVEEWVKYHLDSKEFLKSLPELKTGEAWVWSPSFLQLTKRVQMRRRDTFDSGATPGRAATAAKVSTLADIDVESVRAQLAEVVEQAEKDDPAKLRAEIAQLHQQLLHADKAADDLKKQQEVCDHLRAEIAELRKTSTPEFDYAITAVLQAGNQLADALGQLTKAMTRRKLQETIPVPVETALDAVWKAHNEPVIKLTRSVLPPAATVGKLVDDDLLDAQRRILSVIRMLNVRGIEPTRDNVARWLGIHPNGGSFGANLGMLRREGYLDGLTLTDRGRQASLPMPTGPAGAAQVLEGAQQRIIEVALRKPGLSRDALAAELGIHPNGGSYGANLGRLRVLGLLTERGPIKVTEAYHR